MEHEKPEHIRCRNCIYWTSAAFDEDQAGVEPDDLFGHCKRLPPASSSSQDLLESLARIYDALTNAETELHVAAQRQLGEWPSVVGRWWCGEFRASR